MLIGSSLGCQSDVQKVWITIDSSAGFAVDVSVVEADSNRYKGIDPREVMVFTARRTDARPPQASAILRIV